MGITPVALRTPRVLAVGLLLGLWLFSGCTSFRAIKVAARAREPITPGTSYAIRWQTGLERADTGLRQEIAQMVQVALTAHGLKETQDQAGADIIILLRYGTTRVREALPSLPPLRSEGITRPTPGTDGSVTYPSSSSMNDFDPLPPEISRPEDYFILSAQVGGRPARFPVGFLWRVESKQDHGKGDLQENLPRLAGAALDYVGQDWSGWRRFSGNKYDRAIVGVAKDR